MINQTTVCPHLEQCTKRFAQGDWSSDPPPCLVSPPSMMGEQHDYANIHLAVSSDLKVCPLNTQWITKLWDNGTSQVIVDQLLQCKPDQRLHAIRVIGQANKPELVDSTIELMEEIEVHHDNAANFIDVTQLIGPIAGTEKILGKLYEFANGTDIKLAVQALTAMVDLDAAGWCDYTKQAWLKISLSNDAAHRDMAFGLLKYFSPVAGAALVSNLLEQSSVMGSIPFRNYALVARALVEMFGYDLMCRQLMRLMRDETSLQTLIGVISIAGALGHRAGNTELLKQLSTIVSTRETILRGAAMNALIEMDQRERLVDNFELKKDREAILYAISIANANDWGLPIDPAALTNTMQALDGEVVSLQLAKVIVDRKPDEAIPVINMALQSQSLIMRKFGIWTAGRLGRSIAKPELMANLERVMIVPDTMGPALWALQHMQVEELASSTAKILTKIYYQTNDHLRMHVRIIVANSGGAAIRQELSTAQHNHMSALLKATGPSVLMVVYGLYQPLLKAADNKQFVEAWRCVTDAMINKRTASQLTGIMLKCVGAMMQHSTPEVLQAHIQEIKALFDALRKVNQHQLVEPLNKLAVSKGITVS